MKSDKEVILKAVKINELNIFKANYNLMINHDFIIDCSIINKNFYDAYYNGQNGHLRGHYSRSQLIVQELIDYIEHLYKIEDYYKIIFDELFLDNINYIYKTSHFNNIFIFMLSNCFQFFIKNYKKLVPYIFKSNDKTLLINILNYHLQIFINNYKIFIPYIVDNLEYIQLCQDYNIHIFNIYEVTNNGEYNLKNIKQNYELKYENKIILWY